MSEGRGMPQIETREKTGRRDTAQAEMAPSYTARSVQLDQSMPAFRCLR